MKKLYLFFFLMGLSWAFFAQSVSSVAPTDYPSIDYKAKIDGYLVNVDKSKIPAKGRASHGETTLAGLTPVETTTAYCKCSSPVLYRQQGLTTGAEPLVLKIKRRGQPVKT